MRGRLNCRKVGLTAAISGVVILLAIILPTTVWWILLAAFLILFGLILIFR